MAFLQWNCNGVKTNINKLRILIQELKPLIILIQESHLKATEDFKINKYTAYRHDYTGESKTTH